MILASIAIASALAASSHGTTTIQQSALTTPVVAQLESITGIAQLVPASIAAPSAVFAVFGPAVLRRTRPNRAERRVNLQPLPQNYMYYPVAR
jgi:hypothetical protein